jgi:steroid 5-alpha reductase family enzyme
MAQRGREKTVCSTGFTPRMRNLCLKPDLDHDVFVSAKPISGRPRELRGRICMAVYLEALVLIALALSILMAIAWAVQQRSGNSGWVDTIWTFSLGLVGVGSALWPLGTGALTARQWLVAALVAIWSLRLGVHIAVRTAGIADDPRYAAFAKEWGVDSPRRMFIFLQNQGLGSIPLAFAIFVAAHFPSDTLRAQDYLGALILFAGIAGEAIADAQLKRFRTTEANKGRVCDVGLWRWSRHPNYFFEWFGWLAYPVIAISPDYPWGFASLLAPLFMFWILVYVTGIPPLEQQMLRSRGERYRAYQARTSMFFPLPPQTGATP